MLVLSKCWMEVIDWLMFCCHMRNRGCLVGCSGIGRGVRGRAVGRCCPVHWDGPASSLREVVGVAMGRFMGFGWHGVHSMG